MLVILITSIWSLSFFATFESPNIFKTNSALTYNEVDGMEWFYHFRDNENVMVPFTPGGMAGQQIYRFHILFSDGGSDNNMPIPDHFGYTTGDKTFAKINSDGERYSYLILLTIDELLYQKYRDLSMLVDIIRLTLSD